MKNDERRPELTRRNFMITALGGIAGLLGGCTSPDAVRYHLTDDLMSLDDLEPGSGFFPAETTLEEDLLVQGIDFTRPEIRPVRPVEPLRIDLPKRTYTPPEPQETPAPAFAILPRTVWGAGGVNPQRLARETTFTRLTVHHEGSSAFWATSQAESAARIRQIQNGHMGNGRNMGDIGYHYVIDRAGRIWQGRSIEYRGAHVSGQNERNLGIVLLGNFEIQQPSGAQIVTLTRAIAHFRKLYRIGAVYGHRDLGRTACPGKYLYSQLAAIKRG